MDRWRVVQVTFVAAVLAAVVGLSATWAASTIVDAFTPSAGADSGAMPQREQAAPAQQEANPGLQSLRPSDV